MAKPKVDIILDAEFTYVDGAHRTRELAVVTPDGRERYSWKFFLPILPISGPDLRSEGYCYSFVHGLPKVSRRCEYALPASACPRVLHAFLDEICGAPPYTVWYKGGHDGKIFGIPDFITCVDVEKRHEVPKAEEIYDMSGVMWTRLTVANMWGYGRGGFAIVQPSRLNSFGDT